MKSEADGKRQVTRTTRQVSRPTFPTHVIIRLPKQQLHSSSNGPRHPPLPLRSGLLCHRCQPHTSLIRKIDNEDTPRQPEVGIRRRRGMDVRGQDADPQHHRRRAEFSRSRGQNDPEITAFKGTFFAQPHPYVTPEGLTHGALATKAAASKRARGPASCSSTRPSALRIYSSDGARRRSRRAATSSSLRTCGDKNGAGWDAEWSAPRKQYYADHREMLQQNLTLRDQRTRRMPISRRHTPRCRWILLWWACCIRPCSKGEERPPPGFRGVVSFHGIADEYVAPAPPGMMNQPETPPQPPSSPGITSAAANLAAATADFLGTSFPRANASDASAPSRPATYAPISTARADPFIPNLGGCLSALTARNVMWELQQFGPNTGAKHGFTNPAQRLNDNKAFGYTPIADKASWRYSKAFLETILE